MARHTKCGWRKFDLCKATNWYKLFKVYCVRKTHFILPAHGSCLNILEDILCDERKAVATVFFVSLIWFKFVTCIATPSILLQYSSMNFITMSHERAMASQITGNSNRYQQQVSTKATHYWAFARGIHRWLLISLEKANTAENVSTSWCHLVLSD